MTTLSGGNITLGSVTTTGAGDVFVMSAGTLEAINVADDTADITAGDDVTLSGTTIGATNQIEILGSGGLGSTLSLTTVDGDIDVEELTNAHFGTINLTINDADAATTAAVSLVGLNDNILISDDGTTLSIGAAGITILDNDRNVSLTTTGLNVSIANGGVALTTGDFALSASGGTIRSGSAADDVANITAARVTVTAGTSFGGVGAALDIDADTASINGIAGDIVLDAVGTGGLNLTAATGTAGSITVTTTSEDLTLTNVTANDGSVSVTATGRNITANGVTSSTGSDTNDITLTTLGSGNIALESVMTTGAGDVLVSSAGTLEAVNGASDAPPAIVAGDDVSLVGTTIGATNRIRIEGSGAIGSMPPPTLSLTTGDGDIDVEEINNAHFGTINLTLNDSDAASTVAVGLIGSNDDISITDDGTTMNITANGIVTRDNNRDVTLTLSGLDVSIANGGVDLGSGDFTLNSPGATILSGSAPDNVPNVTASILTVTGVTSLGIGANGAVGIDATTASISSVGGIAVTAVGSGGLDLTAVTSGAGDITVTATEAVTLSNVTAAGGAVSVVTTDQDITATNVASNTDNELHDITLNGRDISLGVVATTGQGDITLTATGAITNVANNVGAEVTTDVLTVTAAASVGASNDGIDVVATRASITGVSGAIFMDTSGGGELDLTASAGGEIDISATNQGMFANNVVSGGNILLTTNTSSNGNIRLGTLTASGGGTIEVDAAGILTASPGGTTVMTDDGTVTERIFTGPLITGTQTGSSLNGNQRQADIDVTVLDGGGLGFGIQIVWGEGSDPDDPLRQPVTDDTIDGLVIEDYSHIYQEAPNPANPEADANIIIRIAEFGVDIDGGSTIVLTENGGQPLQSRSQFQNSVVYNVDTALFPIFLELPQQRDITPLRPPAPIIVGLPATQRVFLVTAPQEQINSIGTTVNTAERYYALRIVTFGQNGEINETELTKDGQEVALGDLEDPESGEGFELSQLPELFKRLPDDRYRLYLIDGQTERLVLDFVIRQGQPVEAQDDAGEGPQSGTPAGEINEMDPLGDGATNRPAGILPVGRASGPSVPADSHQDPRAIEATELRLDAPIESHGSAVERLGSVPVVSSGGVLLGAGIASSGRSKDATESRAAEVERLGKGPRRWMPLRFRRGA